MSKSQEIGQTCTNKSDSTKKVCHRESQVTMKGQKLGKKSNGSSLWRTHRD